MGSPQNPTNEQIKILEKSGQLQKVNSPDKSKVNNGSTMIQLSLPRQGVSLLRLDW